MSHVTVTEIARIRDQEKELNVSSSRLKEFIVRHTTIIHKMEQTIEKNAMKLVKATVNAIKRVIKANDKSARILVIEETTSLDESNEIYYTCSVRKHDKSFYWETHTQTYLDSCPYDYVISMRFGNYYEDKVVFGRCHDTPTQWVALKDADRVFAVAKKE